MSNCGDHQDNDVARLPQVWHQGVPSDDTIAAAVYSALTSGDIWSAERLHQLAEAVDHQAFQRRRLRLVRTLVLLLAGAATAFVVAFPSITRFERAGSGAISVGQDPTFWSSDETLVGLTPANVHAVFPLAQPLGAGADPSASPQQPRDACGTSPLVGVVTPLETHFGQWGTSATQQVGADGGSGTETTVQVVLDATVDTYAAPAEAKAHVAALKESISTCTPQSSGEAPIYPFTSKYLLAAAVYVSDYQDGVLQITVVMIDGPRVATIHGWVPVAASYPALTPDPSSGLTPVPGADPESLSSAVNAMADLAQAVADRGDG